MHVQRQLKIKCNQTLYRLFMSYVARPTIVVTQNAVASLQSILAQKSVTTNLTWAKRIVLEAVIIKQPQCPSTKLDISLWMSQSA